MKYKIKFTNYKDYSYLYDDITISHGGSWNKDKEYNFHLNTARYILKRAQKHFKSRWHKSNFTIKI